MQRDYPMDWFGDRRVPPRVVTTDETLHGEHQGSVYVESGAKLTVAGTLNGSLSLAPDSSVTITGGVNGSLHVDARATALIRGRQAGSVTVAAGGLVEVETGGTAAGSLTVDGVFNNRGTRGGPVAGHGHINDLAGSSVKQPVVRDGVTYYQW